MHSQGYILEGDITIRITVEKDIISLILKRKRDSELQFTGKARTYILKIPNQIVDILYKLNQLGDGERIGWFCEILDEHIDPELLICSIVLSDDSSFRFTFKHKKISNWLHGDS